MLICPGTRRIFQGLTINSLKERPVPVGIKVRDNESIDRALRRFKRAVNRSRVLRIFRANMAFTKPSEERRLAREKAARNARKRSRYY